MDWLLFWYDHNRLPVLSRREQVVFCAATRHAGYMLRLPVFAMKRRDK